LNAQFPRWTNFSGGITPLLPGGPAMSYALMWVFECDVFLSSSEVRDQYNWHNFEGLHEPDIWAKMNKVRICVFVSACVCWRLAHRLTEGCALCCLFAQSLFMRKFMRLSMRCWRVPENGLHGPLTQITHADSDEEARLKKYASPFRSER